MKTIVLAAVALLLNSCASGNLQVHGDMTSLGIPATISYSSKNPVYSK